jgi:GcrA cell cycle regulator
MDWTAEAIERLRALWAEGHSTAEIGRRMGVSKNAVVGKAHRLNLPARPSPIRRETTGIAAQPTRVTPRSSPAVHAPLAADPAPAAAPPAPRAASAAPRPAAMAAPPAGVVRAFPRLGSARSCCWPIGEPGTPEFRFCSAEATSGKPYCTQHAAVAYVKARDRREDAA